MIFYDFEVFLKDWLVVLMDTDKKKKHVIVNDSEQLKQFYEDHVNDIWVGYNSRHYDQYILKAILLGIDPKKVNDEIIINDTPAWKISSAFKKIPLINYDVMPNPPIGLKTLEGFMGSNIKETDVDFDIKRKLTPEEIEMTVQYCTHDVEQTMEVFMHKKDDFNSMLAIVKKFNLSLDHIGDTEARITSTVLGCQKRNFRDEFEYEFESCIQLKKYKFVQEWFDNAVQDAEHEMDELLKTCKPADKWKYDKNDYKAFSNYFYSRSITYIAAGVPHTSGFGGIHGAPDEPVHEKGALYHVDVNNYYPSYAIAWGRVTRAASNDNYHITYNIRKELKGKQVAAIDKNEAKKWKKAQLPYKKMLNALTGAMKDSTNPAHDPCYNNCICINGQLMLLDLIEHLEVIPGFKLIQSNTDGLIVKIPDTDEAFNMLDDICYEWEQRCSTDKCEIGLALDQLKEIYQGDVNNYLWIDPDGSIGERKGAYVKELSPLDYDLPIVNKAICEYLAFCTPIEKTINECTDMIEFQKIVKLSGKYTHVLHEHCIPKTITTGVRKKKIMLEYEKTDRYTYKCYRVYASKDIKDGRLLKDGGKRGKPEKFANTPEHCHIVNEDVTQMKCPEWLDKQYYIDLAKKRLKEKFGVIV